MLDRNPSFALELSQGAVLELPEPRGRTRRSPPKQESPRPSQTKRAQSPDLSRTLAERTRTEQTERTDPRTVIQLEARVLEANRWALAAQREAERLSARVQELERALQDSSDGRELIRRTASERARARDEAEVRAALSGRQRAS